MTREEILNMPAGREMDALIAERVFKTTEDDDWGSDGLLSFSTDIAAAWQVVEKLKPNYPLLDMYCIGDWASSFGDGEWGYGYAETAPLAICRAALIATQGPRHE
jgi:hypothetical protein